MTEYIYLLQEREFIRLNEPIYKIGKTKQENLKRIQNYPNGTRLLLQIICNNCDNLEKELIQLFKSKYKIQTDIGKEYFKGNHLDMIKDIYSKIFNTNDTKIKDNDYKYYKNIKLFNSEFLYEHKLKFKYYLKNEFNIIIDIKNYYSINDIESITLELCWIDYKSENKFNISFINYLLNKFNTIKLTHIKIYDYSANNHIEYLKDLSLFIYIHKYETNLNNNLNSYQIFVKEQMKIFKDNGTNLTGKELMKEISELWKQKKKD